MRVLVTGGRDFTDRPRVFAALDAIHAETPITVLIHGGAKGADSLAAEWAYAKGGIRVEAFLADWKRYGQGAGVIRNRDMLHEGQPDIVVAFPGGKGTRHMTSITTQACVPLYLR